MLETERHSATNRTSDRRGEPLSRTRRAQEAAAAPTRNAQGNGRQTKSFEELFRGVLERAYAAATYLTRDAADAEDLVQEAALHAFAGFETFEPDTNFKAWFLRILTNCFYMRQRRLKCQAATVSLDEAGDLYLYSKTKNVGLHDDDPDPARTLMSKLETEQVAEAIRALPDDFRVAATLYFIEDRSYKDIAEILDCPVGTVRSRLHRGRKLLQVALWRIAEDHGLVPRCYEGVQDPSCLPEAAVSR